MRRYLQREIYPLRVDGHFSSTPRTGQLQGAGKAGGGSVGNNLNQLARIANFNGKAEDAYLQEAQQIMTRIWLLMKEQL